MSKCTQSSAAPHEITRGSQKHYRAMFKVNKGDILATVKLSSCDLAVLEFWGVQSKWDNRGEKHKINTLLRKCTYFGHESYESHHSQIYCRDIHADTHTHTCTHRDTDSLNIIFFINSFLGSKIARVLTFFNHADTETLLEPAVLASVTTSLVHWAVFICQTNIFCIFLNCSLRKCNTKIVN